jgi:hypothetical protein
MKRTDPFADAVVSVFGLLLFGLKRLWRVLFPRRVPKGALILGVAHPLHAPRDAAQFWLTSDQRARHMHVVGASGTGKTKALEGWIQQDMARGRGCGVIDLHGDLTRNLVDFLAASPAGRRRRVYLIDPSVRSVVPGFNPLEVLPGVEPYGQALELIGVFQKIWAEFWGPRMDEILRNCLLALMEQRLTLLELAPFLTDRNFRLRIVGKVDNPGVKEFWLARFDKLSTGAQTAYVEPVLNKVGTFTGDPYLRAVLGQERSTIDLRRIMDRGDVLLANLSKGALKENALLLGALLVTKVQLAALSRTDLPEVKRRPFVLYVDEFQHFATDAFGEILAEARKYSLRLVLAHQHLGQLGRDLRAALLGNVLTHVAFRLSVQDAKALAPDLSPAFREQTERVLVGLPNRRAVVRRRSDPATHAPWLLELPAVASQAMTAEVLEQFKSQIGRRGRPVGAIEEEIRTRQERLGILGHRNSGNVRPAEAVPSSGLAEVE